ncbi:hypothetical protein [Mycobacterium sp. 1164966.3]|uniref:hypothetical protein n=1 Tax=Mycobacterium sp. 1164966.3 TaxID=1856861 RepID=UPI0012E77169|nr:hypothetical protein [Mycobacterium sp. 1164966.3]
MRAYFSRWRQPTRRDIAALILFSALVVLGAVWTFHEVQKHSQEAKKAKYETCIHEAQAKHVLPLPSLDEIQACKQQAGVK